jgi:hypothetical protein
MAKIDLKKELKSLYVPSAKEVTLIDVPEMNFIMVDGQGAPESEQYQQSIEALYPIAYTIKFARKKADGTDFTVMALEGLWWAEDFNEFDPETGDRNRWQWTMMMMQPDFITPAEFQSAREAAAKKKSNPLIAKVRFESFKEGKSVQIMHIGPFAAEGPNIQRIHQKIQEIGGKLYGKHHEIYMSDPRRGDPAKIKTVLRQPYRM